MVGQGVGGRGGHHSPDGAPWDGDGGTASGLGPKDGHRPALTPGLDTQASPDDVGTQTAAFLLAMVLKSKI